MKAWLCLLPALLCAQAPVVSGDAEISGLVGGQPLVIRTTSRLAGAIDSVKWAGVEFIDSHDHGRQLQSAINNLTSNSTNLSDARSRIMDADYSAETTTLAKAQILSQASTAMIAQANQAQQNVLSLLK